MNDSISRPYLNDVAEIGDGEVVRATQILMTNTVVISAWRRFDGSISESGYTTVTRDDDLGWLGRIGSGPLPAEVDALPYGSPERIVSCGRLREVDARDAVAAIELAYPGITSSPYANVRENGEVTIDVVAFRLFVGARSAA